MKRFIQFVLIMSVILLNISSLYAQVGIGITNPSAMLHNVAAGSKSASYNGTLLVNDATSTTAGITKTGLSVSSTGTWSGINSVNRGLYVNATGGPTTSNYAAIFEGGPVGIGLTNPAATSILELAGTGKGILIPRWTNTNRPASPATGLLYYQTDGTPGFYYYTGSAWSGPLSTTTGTVTGTATAGQVAYWDDTDNITGNNNLFWDAANSRLGLGTTSPSYMLGLGGNAIRAIAMERNTVANTAGNRLTMQAGGATVGATDKSGGELRLASGLSTGTGSSFISFYTYPAGTAGTTDNAGVEQMRISGAGNIGIGIIPTSTEKLYVSEAFPDLAGTGIHSSVSQTTTAAATANLMGSRITIRPNVTSGVTNSGVAYGQYIDANRSTAADAGTYTGIAGQRILYGHSSAASGAPTTTTAYGIWLSPYTVTGTISNIYGLYIATPTLGGTVGNHWGVYQAYTSADNYFGGTVGIKNTAPAYPLDVTGVIRSGGPGTDGGLRLYSEIGATDYEVLIQPSASMSANYTLTLPATDGNTDQILTTNGSGVLSWSNATASAWGLSGNGSTTPGTDFVGTTDNQALVFKTNNVEKMRIRSGAGGLGIGTTLPDSPLRIDTNYLSEMGFQQWGGLTTLNTSTLIHRMGATPQRSRYTAAETALQWNTAFQATDTYRWMNGYHCQISGANVNDELIASNLSSLTWNGTGTLTAMGLAGFIYNNTAPQTINYSYAIRGTNERTGGNHYGIWVNAEKNFLQGNLGVGTIAATAPDSRLRVNGSSLTNVGYTPLGTGSDMSYTGIFVDHLTESSVYQDDHFLSGATACRWTDAFTTTANYITGWHSALLSSSAANTPFAAGSLASVINGGTGPIMTGIAGNVSNATLPQTPARTAAVQAENSRTGLTDFGMYIRGNRNYIEGFTGIGAADPSVYLDVNGNGRFRLVGSGAYSAPLNITSDGTLTTATSDIRMKENIRTISNALESVLNMRGVVFNWKSDEAGADHIGFIAQELEKVVPEVVFTNPTDGYKGVQYGEVTAVLVEAVKEQQKLIESLQQTILGMEQEKSQLKAENDEFKARLSGIETKLNRMLGTENPTALNGK